MKLLVIEDDPKIAALLARGFREAGYTVDIAENGTEGLHRGSSGPYDAAIVDVMLPGIDGLALVQQLRDRGVDVPVLFLSARRSVDDRIKGLQAGGDDYLTKPFSFSEALARIQALIRRATRTPESTALSFEDLELDLLKREALRDGQVIPLQPREFGLLEYLMRNPGRIISKTSILEKIYDYGFDPQTNVVDVLVHRLRSKVDKGFEPKLIHTVRGAGYVLRK